MIGYDDSTYGERFADVYDDWYSDVSDVESTVAFITKLAIDAGGERAAVLELGVGTGRLALPIAAKGVAVVGLDSSPAMLARLADKDPDGTIEQVLGDMVDDMPAGPFDVVFVAYNTFFGLLTAERQAACFAAVAQRLRPGGAFVIEAFVPNNAAAEANGNVTVRSITADRVVLAISQTDPVRQSALGQYVEISESGGIRLRPWQIRFAAPAELDNMAHAGGMRLDERYEHFDRTPFDDDSQRHVSVYR
jgi:SAM-dependent methyltransferase